jgi:hypothetical protein
MGVADRLYIHEVDLAKFARVLANVCSIVLVHSELSKVVIRRCSVTSGLRNPYRHPYAGERSNFVDDQLLMIAALQLHDLRDSLRSFQAGGLFSRCCRSDIR